MYPVSATAAPLQMIALPKPQRQGDKPSLQTVSERQTSRNLGTDKQSQQQLSNLLFAAFGVNRDDGRRTAPSVKRPGHTHLRLSGRGRIPV
jgi:hypothetical protein